MIRRPGVSPENQSVDLVEMPGDYRQLLAESSSGMCRAAILLDAVQNRTLIDCKLLEFESLVPRNLRRAFVLITFIMYWSCHD
jgi:hypothetical protein